MANQSLYQRGSKWRKWDLQIHCPDDVLNNQFNGKTSDEKWESYIAKIERTDLEGVGLTNYFCINGYEKILSYKKKGRLDKIKIILSNIEFRLSQPNRSGEYINLHVIFSDSVSIKKIKDFLARLPIIGTDSKNRSLFCTENDLQQIGYDKALVEFSELRKKLKENFVHRKDYLIAGVSRGYGSFRPSPNEGRGASLAIEIDKISDFFFGKIEDVNFFLGIGRYKNAKPKPVVRVSDAHRLEKIGSEFSWIKADPTFEGLKQIIYEPELRTSLGERPELYLYPQIISVQLKGVERYQGQQDIEDFPPINLGKQIFFSSNLTNIVGPRASGKTVLVELLNYPFNQHQKEAKKDEKLPLIRFLSKRFPGLTVEILYQQGEKEIDGIKRKIVDLLDPFYTPPLTMEYWSQGQIEQVANKKEKLDEYIRNRLESTLLSNLSLKIDELKENLKKLREKYLRKFEVEIEQKKLLAEKKQIEEYFEKLKTKEYKDLIKKIRENRTNSQLLDTFIENIQTIIKFLEEANKQFSFISLPDKGELLKLFPKSPSTSQEIENFYKFIKSDFATIIKRFPRLQQNISSSEERKRLAKEATLLKKEFLAYCKKHGVKITQLEYEKRTKRLDAVNRQLRVLEAKLKEYEAAKETHSQFAQQLNRKLAKWEEENNRILKKFNKLSSKTNVRVVWDNPFKRLPEWIKKQFLASDSVAKPLIRKYFYIFSPVKENFIEEIVKELVESKKYSIEKIIENLNNKERPALVKSGGKQENLKWFFQRDETEIMRKDLIMRLQEYAERGINLIQYKGKILGKDSMSFGERCGTLIELILQSGDHPLIIDQPEEHLDSKFIADRVVNIIRGQKIKRQIIICTHNANIVVLGDSELVTVLSADRQGTDAYQGSLENSKLRKQIYDVLEGGPEAFKKREQKYGFK